MRIKEINIVGSRTINIGNYESRHASYGMTVEVDGDYGDLGEARKEAERWIKEKLDRFENGWKNPQKEVKERVKEMNNNFEESPF